MFTVTRKHDVGDGSVPVGTADTTEELHDLLRERHGTFSVTSDASPRTIRLELGCAVPVDTAFTGRIAELLAS